MRRSVVAGIALLGIGTLLGGCAGPSGPAAPAAPIGPLSAATPSFLALDPATQAAIDAPYAHARRLADGRLEVVVDLRNRGGGPVRALAQCVFFGGQAQPDATAWQPVNLAAGETLSVRFTAAGAAADRYVVRVGGATRA